MNMRRWNIRWKWMRRAVRRGAIEPLVCAVKNNQGVTTLEWTLLLAVIALPSYLIIRIALLALIGHYRMVTTLNSLPTP